MKEYTLGFLFNHNRRQVALIKKSHPAWQAGKLNGIGGKSQEGETPLQAQIREFSEEAGVNFDNWLSVCTFEGPEVYDPSHFDPAGFKVHVFVGVAPEDGFWEYLTNMTDEPIYKLDIISVLFGQLALTENLPWLLTMAAGRIDPGYSGVTFKIIEEQP